MDPDFHRTEGRGIPPLGSETVVFAEAHVMDSFRDRINGSRENPASSTSTMPSSLISARRVPSGVPMVVQ